MRIILTATDAALFDAWVRHCGDLPEVTFYRGSILDLTVDAVVSPANSFGFMDGGIDQVYRDFFGRKVEQDLQSRIKADHDGELLVGHAVLVHTYNTKIPFLIAAPTMRVPSPSPVRPMPISLLAPPSPSFCRWNTGDGCRVMINRHGHWHSPAWEPVSANCLRISVPNRFVQRFSTFAVARNFRIGSLTLTCGKWR